MSNLDSLKGGLRSLCTARCAGCSASSDAGSHWVAFCFVLVMRRAWSRTHHQSFSSPTSLGSFTASWTRVLKVLGRLATPDWLVGQPPPAGDR